MVGKEERGWVKKEDGIKEHIRVFKKKDNSGVGSEDFTEKWAGFDKWDMIYNRAKKI